MIILFPIVPNLPTRMAGMYAVIMAEAAKSIAPDLIVRFPIAAGTFGRLPAEFL